MYFDNLLSALEKENIIQLKYDDSTELRYSFTPQGMAKLGLGGNWHFFSFYKDQDKINIWLPKCEPITSRYNWTYFATTPNLIATEMEEQQTFKKHIKYMLDYFHINVDFDNDEYVNLDDIVF